MKVFTNGTDTVVARDLLDVKDVIEGHYGSTFEEEGWTLAEWGEVPDDEHIRIVDFDGRGNVASFTARHWIERDGRGLLCSTEY